MTSIERAELSLDGLSMGDPFGQMFFGDEQKMLAMIARHELPLAPGYLTDDSIMAIITVMSWVILAMRHIPTHSGH